MFFSAVWFYGAVALLILGMATRQPALTVLATLILLTAGVSWLWNRYSLHAVTYGRRLGSTRVFRGETLALRLELVNRKLLPLAWIEVEDEFADRLETVDRRATPASNPTRMILPYLTSLRPYERVAWTATLRCPARGAFTFGPVTLRSGDIFGFYRQNLRLHLHDSIIVYPRISASPRAARSAMCACARRCFSIRSAPSGRATTGRRTPSGIFTGKRPRARRRCRCASSNQQP
jgi:uncharacterized protein (DUF58 family)